MENYITYSDLEKYNTKLIKIIVLTFLSIIPTVFIPHVGEEGVYTISSVEMLYNKNFFQVMLYGGYYPRPPLYNWLIIATSYIFPSDNLLLSARVVAILSSFAMAAIVGYLTSRLWQHLSLGILTAAIFLSGDLLLRRGWLAYSDPTFSLCVFASMAFLWLAVHEEKYLLLAISLFCLTCGFLTKVHTAYVFYGITWCVLFWGYSQKRKWLLNKKTIICYILALAFPIIWTYKVNHPGAINDTTLNIMRHLKVSNLWPHLSKIVLYPLNIILITLPTSMVLMLYVAREKINIKKDFIFRMVIIITILNVLPYWVATESCIRYIMPLYPFFAMISTYIISQSSVRLLSVVVKFLFIGVVINFLIITFWFPYDQTVRKGNAKIVAQKILSIVQNDPLYTNDSSSVGLRVTAELNALRKGKPPLGHCGKNSYGYLLTKELSVGYGGQVYNYDFGKKKMYMVKMNETKLSR